MDNERLFRVLDTYRPKVAQVQAYLEWISRNSPFELLFVKDGKRILTKKLDRDLGELVGVVIESTIFLTQTMGKKYPMDITVIRDKVFAFGKTIYPTARPMSSKDLLLLGKHRENYRELQDMVKVFGYSIAPLQDYYIPLDYGGDNCWNQDHTCADIFDLDNNCDGNSDIANFLHFRNIIFCADYQE